MISNAFSKASSVRPEKCVHEQRGARSSRARVEIVSSARPRCRLGAEQVGPKNDARIIAHTKLIGGGETTTVSFPTAKLKKGGDYTFFCSFPGHWAQMKGKLTFG
jgi:azurin